CEDSTDGFTKHLLYLQSPVLYLISSSIRDSHSFHCTASGMRSVSLASQFRFTAGRWIWTTSELMPETSSTTILSVAPISFSHSQSMAYGSAAPRQRSALPACSATHKFILLTRTNTQRASER